MSHSITIAGREPGRGQVRGSLHVFDETDRPAAGFRPAYDRSAIKSDEVAVVPRERKLFCGSTAVLAMKYLVGNVNFRQFQLVLVGNGTVNSLVSNI